MTSVLLNSKAESARIWGKVVRTRETSRWRLQPGVEKQNVLELHTLESRKCQIIGYDKWPLSYISDLSKISP